MNSAMVMTWVVWWSSHRRISNARRLPTLIAFRAAACICVRRESRSRRDVCGAVKCVVVLVGGPPCGNCCCCVAFSCGDGCSGFGGGGGGGGGTRFKRVSRGALAEDGGAGWCVSVCIFRACCGVAIAVRRVSGGGIGVLSGVGRVRWWHALEAMFVYGLLLWALWSCFRQGCVTVGGRCGETILGLFTPGSCKLHCTCVIWVFCVICVTRFLLVVWYVLVSWFTTAQLMASFDWLFTKRFLCLFFRPFCQFGFAGGMFPCSVKMQIKFNNCMVRSPSERDRLP